MAKKRLNMGHRDLMKRLVRETVVPDQEKKDEVIEQMTAALYRLRNSIIKRYGPSNPYEKAVLEKYDLMVSLPQGVRVAISNPTGDDIGSWAYMNTHHMGVRHENVFVEVPDHLQENKTIPIGAIRGYSEYVKVSKETYDQYKAAEAACDSLLEEVHNLRKKYYQLIDGSRTFEDVEAIWPRVGQLRETICGTSSSLVVLSSETISAIQEHEDKVADTKDNDTNNKED